MFVYHEPCVDTLYVSDQVRLAALFFFRTVAVGRVSCSSLWSEGLWKMQVIPGWFAG